MIVFYISIIILAFDIIWQFLIAGIYAPKKAERLVVNNPRIKRLEQLVVTLESKSRSSAAVGSGAGQELLDKIDFYDHRVTELSNKLDEIHKLKDSQPTDIRKELTGIEERLRGAINGSIGKLSSEFYDETGITEEDKKENKELVKLATNTMAQEQQIDFYYQILEPMVGAERGEKLAVGLVRAPKWLKGIVKKKIGNIIKDYGG